MRSLFSAVRTVSSGRTVVSAHKPPPTAWPLPQASISPKLLTPESRAIVDREVRRFDAAVPINRSPTPPSSWYISPLFAQAELASIFSRSWQFACRCDQVANPGDFVATFIGQEPVVVLRADDGSLRAYSNVCRHHAARICEGEGHATSLVCPYHQWTYNLDGRLIKATRLKGIEGFSAAKVFLPSYRVDTWGPLVFVNLTSPKAVDANDPIQRPLAEQVKQSEQILEENGGWEGGEVPWRSLGHVKRRVYEIGCNWKVYSDNYLDGGYHIPHLHGGLNSELDMSTYETQLFDTASVQTCVSKSERVGKAATYLYLFPNLAVNKYGLWMDTNVVLPLAVDRCVVIFDWYHKEATTRKEELLTQLDSSVAIQDEDVYISESVQNGLLSKTYDVGRYAPGVEIAAHHFHLLISNGVNRYLRDEAAHL